MSVTELEKRAAVRMADERAIVALIYEAAACADERRFMDWVALFSEDATYGAITYENLANRLYLYKDRGQRALQERAAYQIAIWQVPRGKILHLVTNIVVSAGETNDLAHAKSNFIVTRTGELEHSKLHAAGAYRDTFQRKGDAWLFKAREVIVDSQLLPAEFTELL